MPTNSSQSQPVKKARCAVYIDGFNWYYGIFALKPEWKWLNIQSFFEELRKDDDVTVIKYFTALLEPDSPYNEARNRQKNYIKALKSLNKMEIVYGYFQPRDNKCRASCGQEYSSPQEKKTDVNLALAMVSDAIIGNVDSMVLVSGDCDFQPAVEWLMNNYPKIKVTVYVPSLDEEKSERRSDYYHRLRVPCKFLPVDKMLKHQLPKKFAAGDRFVEIPEGWK